MGFGTKIILFDLQLSSWLEDSADTGEQGGERQYSLWFAWASVLQVDLFKKERWGRNNGGAMRVPSLWPFTRKPSLQRQFFIVLKS